MLRRRRSGGVPRSLSPPAFGLSSREPFSKLCTFCFGYFEPVLHCICNSVLWSLKVHFPLRDGAFGLRLSQCLVGLRSSRQAGVHQWLAGARLSVFLDSHISARFTIKIKSRVSVSNTTSPYPRTGQVLARETDLLRMAVPLN
ncbi:hypothetical protein DY000_02049603 [Brassica cretica]|uniref:Uncharacterized protein n=1 Tax=Brassica cretica TaxID=69181 RepID=A0ABQ7F0W4_BRACR|nr:hypothetical protein DY000_02049603 [Brassica cretica]